MSADLEHDPRARVADDSCRRPGEAGGTPFMSPGECGQSVDSYGRDQGSRLLGCDSHRHALKPWPARGHLLPDADVAPLSRIEAGEHTFRPSSAARHGETIEVLIDRLRSLRDRGLIRLPDSRIMRGQDGRSLVPAPAT